MRVFTSFLTVIAIFCLSGCSNSSIKMPTQNQLLITNDKTEIEVTAPFVETKNLNMGSIYIDQNIIAVDDENCIVYEDIRTAGNYRFNYGYKQSIDLIFNAYSVEEGKHYGNLTLYRVTLRDEQKSVINLLALTASKKSLKLIYGFDDKALSTIEKDLSQNNTVIKYTLRKDSGKKDQCIKSNWQPKLLIMDNLIGTEGGHIRGPGL